MAGENPSAKKLRENDKQIAAQDQPKSLLHWQKGKAKTKKRK